MEDNVIEKAKAAHGSDIVKAALEVLESEKEGEENA